MHHACRRARPGGRHPRVTVPPGLGVPRRPCCSGGPSGICRHEWAARERCRNPDAPAGAGGHAADRHGGHGHDAATDGCYYCRTNCDKWNVEANKRHCHDGGSAGCWRCPPNCCRTPASGIARQLWASSARWRARAGRRLAHHARSPGSSRRLNGVGRSAVMASPFPQLPVPPHRSRTDQAPNDGPQCRVPSGA